MPRADRLTEVLIGAQAQGPFAQDGQTVDEIDLAEVANSLISGLAQKRPLARQLRVSERGFKRNLDAEDRIQVVIDLGAAEACIRGTDLGDDGRFVEIDGVAEAGRPQPQFVPSLPLGSLRRLERAGFDKELARI